MPKKETKTLVIIVLVIDLIFIGAFVFLFIFTQNMVDESASKVNDIKTELKKEDGVILMKDSLALGKMYQEKLADYIMPAEGTVNFITTIEQLVANTRLKSDIKTVTNVPYNKGDAIGEELLKVDLVVNGGWSNIQFFLNSLENYPLKININNVSLNKISDATVKGKNVPVWSGSIEFTVVKVKDKK